MSSQLPLKKEARIVWMPDGLLPTEDDFNRLADPNPNKPIADPWWELGEAIVYSTEVVLKHGAHDPKRAWIKYGDTLMSPEEIRAAYNCLKPPAP